MGTSSKAVKRGDLMAGTSTTSIRAKPAEFWGNRFVQHLGLSANRQSGEESLADGVRIAASQSGAPIRIVGTNRELSWEQ